MRKTVVLLAAAILLSGCSIFSSSLKSVADRVYIGMSVKEFQTLTEGKASLELLEEGLAVYRMDEYQTYDGQFFVIASKFFYFDSSNKLFKMDSADFRGDFQRMVAHGNREKSDHKPQ